MRSLQRLPWLFALLPLGLFGAAACGGSVFEAGGVAGAGQGGSGVAGSLSSAGSGTAGSGHAGGSSSAGGSSGGASSAGASSSGGAVGSAGSGGADMRDCTSNTDCEVVPVSCCSCGMGPVSAFTSINSKYSQEYNSRCGVVDCAGCPPVAYDPNNPVFYYVATCRKSGNLSAGKCEVYDLRDVNSAVTACKTEMDCTLRSGTGCCPGCGSQPVAININQEPALESLVCGTEPSACLDCAPTFTGYGTSCSGGRCSVQLTPCTIEHPCPL